MSLFVYMYIAVKWYRSNNMQGKYLPRKQVIINSFILESSQVVVSLNVSQASLVRNIPPLIQSGLF